MSPSATPDPFSYTRFVAIVRSARTFVNRNPVAPGSINLNPGLPPEATLNSSCR